MKYEKIHNCKIDIVLLVQGDEPMIDSSMIKKAVYPLISDKNLFYVPNLVGKILNQKEFNDPNCIKVVSDKNSNAIYFSKISHTSSKQI